MRRLVVVLLLLCAELGSYAQGVVVTCSAAGAPGNWTVDFRLTNKMESVKDMSIFFFGVRLEPDVDAVSVLSSPDGYAADLWPNWTNKDFAGSSILYNLVWTDESSSHVLPGSSQHGFSVRYTGKAMPSLVKWFVIGQSKSQALYEGQSSFGSDLMPGFEGVLEGCSTVRERR